MKDILFLDTNIVLDLLGHRLPHYEAIAKIVTLAENGELQLSVSALSFATAHYILAKVEENNGRLKNLDFLKCWCRLAIDEQVIEAGLNTNVSDYEDALQYFCAFKGGCGLILTRNGKDFKDVTLPVMTAEEYLASIGRK